MKKFFRTFFMIIGILFIVAGGFTFIVSVTMGAGEAIVLAILYIPLIIIGCLIIARCRRSKKEADQKERVIDKDSLSTVKITDKEQLIWSEFVAGLSEDEKNTLYTMNYVYNKFKKAFPQGTARFELSEKEDKPYSFHFSVEDVGDDELYAYRKYRDEIVSKYGDNFSEISDINQQEIAMRKKYIDYLNRNYLKDDPIDSDLATQFLSNCVFYNPVAVQYGYRKRPYYIRMMQRGKFPKLDELIKSKEIRIRSALAKLFIATTDET